MSDIAIRVEHLSKRYRLGQREVYKNLREVLTNAAKAPIGWIQHKRAGTAESDPGYFWALDDISFEVKQGEAVGIIGRNGAGKSTLLKILSRITKPTRGQAEIYGRVGSLLEVGTGFHPELSGRENIYLNGTILGMRRAEIARKFDEIVEFSEIEKFLDTPVKRYSSGMYVRLAFAVAAHLEPEILLVDEVLAVGDAAFQKKCLGKMGEVAQGGRTILFVSHNMHAIASLCRSSIWLDKGHVKEISDTHSIVDSYLIGYLQAETINISLDEIKRPSPLGEKLRITGIELNSGTSVKNGMPLEISLGFIAFEKLTDVSFGIGFSTLEGTRIITMRSDFGSKRSIVFPQQKGTVTAYFPTFQLSPGHYYIDIGVGSGVAALDYLPACTRIQVYSSQDSPYSEGSDGYWCLGQWTMP